MEETNEKPSVTRKVWGDFLQKLEKAVQDRDQVGVARAVEGIAPHLKESVEEEGYDEGLGLVLTYKACGSVPLPYGGKVEIEFQEVRTWYGTTIDQSDTRLKLTVRNSLGREGELYISAQDHPTNRFYVEGRNVEVLGLDPETVERGGERGELQGGNCEVEV